MTDAIYIWFADNGNIRKWQSQPFAEGAEYVPASTVTSLQTQLEADTTEPFTVQDAIDWLNQHLSDRDQVATASVARADEAFRLLGEAVGLLSEIAEPARVDPATSSLNIWARCIETIRRAQSFLTSSAKGPEHG